MSGTSPPLGPELLIRGYTCALCLRGALVATSGSAWHGLLIAAACVLLGACGGSGGGNNNPILNTGFVRAINSVPDSPTLGNGLSQFPLGRASFAQSTKLTQLPINDYALNIQYIDATGKTISVI